MPWKIPPTALAHFSSLSLPAYRNLSRKDNFGVAGQVSSAIVLIRQSIPEILFLESVRSYDQYSIINYINAGTLSPSLDHLNSTVPRKLHRAAGCGASPPATPNLCAHHQKSFSAIRILSRLIMITPCNRGLAAVTDMDQNRTGFVEWRMHCPGSYSAVIFQFR
jgi:hypothetical protein